jgi:hypothetical protein
VPETISTDKTQAKPPLVGQGSASALKDVEESYRVENPSAVSNFISENRLEGLLLEARGPLATAFGSQSPRILRLVSDSEGFTTLFCLVAMPGPLERALEAREAFDRSWWLDRCAGAAGKLNFDFEPV